ncbi:MAG: TOBE domain-containing protein, partial [Rhizobiaceae bacterium]
LSRGQNGDPIGLSTTVRDITFLGNNTHVSTVTDWNEALSVRLPFGHEAVSGLSRGDKVWISWDPASAHAFCDQAA